MNRIYLIVFSLLLFVFQVHALDSIKISDDVIGIKCDSVKTKKKQPLLFSIDTRVDWNAITNGEVDSLRYRSSFGGTALMMILKGNINKYFSFDMRYRLNKQLLEHSKTLFDPADWIFVTYSPNKNWHISVGKFLVFRGSFEFDKNPMDVYLWSAWDNRIGCFQMGLQGRYISTDGRNDVMLQISNSPFITKPFQSLYDYNVHWSGDFGLFKALYSVALTEYSQKKYGNIISLGNQFNFGPVSLELDYMNRYYGSGNFFEDFSIIGRVKYNITNYLSVIAKAGCDYNPDGGDKDNEKLINPAVRLVDIGMDRIYYGAAIEYFPIKNHKEFHVHAYWYSGNEFNYKQHTFGIGVRYQLKVIDRK